MKVMKQEVERLFIGGSMNGKRLTVPVEAYTWASIAKLENFTVLEEPPAMVRLPEREFYHLETITTPISQVYFFILDSLSIEQALEMLVANYNPSSDSR